MKKTALILASLLTVSILLVGCKEDKAIVATPLAEMKEGMIPNFVSANPETNIENFMSFVRDQEESESLFINLDKIAESETLTRFLNPDNILPIKHDQLISMVMLGIVERFSGQNIDYIQEYADEVIQSTLHLLIHETKLTRALINDEDFTDAYWTFIQRHDPETFATYMIYMAELSSGLMEHDPSIDTSDALMIKVKDHIQNVTLATLLGTS